MPAEAMQRRKTAILGINHDPRDRRTKKEGWKQYIGELKKLPQNASIGIEIPHDLPENIKAVFFGEMKKHAENLGFRVSGIDTSTHFNLRLLHMSKLRHVFYDRPSVKRAMLMNEFRNNNFIRQARKKRFDLILVGAAHAQDIADYIPNSKLVLPPRTRKNLPSAFGSWAVYEDKDLLKLLGRIREKRASKFPVG